MNKHLFILTLIGAILVISACKKEEEEAVDKFVGSLSGVYRLWDCGTGGSAELVLIVENSTLSVIQIGPESYEVTCIVPDLGDAFKCQGTISSDSTMYLPNCVHYGITYNGEYLIRRSGGRSVYLFQPNINCKFLDSPIGNVAWTYPY